ncbi:hypothetical protein F4779DRAFT_623696 [Xylariaceae sp. FL0662B]|nr:hypothetical protein F4779DRAFT_623696 [Xylariaceae sp. FL0662B]
MDWYLTCHLFDDYFNDPESSMDDSVHEGGSDQGLSIIPWDYRTRPLTLEECLQVTRIYEECPGTCSCSTHRDPSEEAPVPFNRVEFPAVWFCRRVNTAGIDQMLRNELQTMVGARTAKQRGQGQQLCKIDKSADDAPQQYVAQRARGAYIASVCQPEASFDLSTAAQVIEPTEKDIDALNDRIEWQMNNLTRGLRYVPLDLNNTKLFIFTDGSFANNKDLSSQLGFIIVLATEDRSDTNFEIYGNIIHWKQPSLIPQARQGTYTELTATVSGFPTPQTHKMSLASHPPSNMNQNTPEKRLGTPTHLAATAAAVAEDDYGDDSDDDTEDEAPATKKGRRRPRGRRLRRESGREDQNPMIITSYTRRFSGTVEEEIPLDAELAGTPAPALTPTPTPAPAAATAPAPEPAKKRKMGGVRGSKANNKTNKSSGPESDNTMENSRESESANSSNQRISTKFYVGFDLKQWLQRLGLLLSDARPGSFSEHVLLALAGIEIEKAEPTTSAANETVAAAARKRKRKRKSVWKPLVLHPWYVQQDLQKRSARQVNEDQICGWSADS